VGAAGLPKGQVSQRAVDEKVAEAWEALTLSHFHPILHHEHFTLKAVHRESGASDSRPPHGSGGWSFDRLGHRYHARDVRTGSSGRNQ